MSMICKKVLYIITAAGVVSATGCMERVSAYDVAAPHCPSVSVVAAGRMVNAYAIYVDIAEQEPVLLVPNIDMPEDVNQYVKFARPSATGIEIGVVNSDYVKDLEIRVSNTCQVKTVKVGA